MDKCLNCGKELKHIDGRRKKTFCNDTCRSNYWYKKNVSERLNKVIIQATEKSFVETHDAVMEQKTTTKGILIQNDDNDSKIAELEAELKTVPDNNTFGRQRRKWIQNEILKLKHLNNNP